MWQLMAEAPAPHFTRAPGVGAVVAANGGGAGKGTAVGANGVGAGEVAAAVPLSTTKKVIKTEEGGAAVAGLVDVVMAEGGAAANGHG